MAVDETYDRFGRIDTAIRNAGIRIGKPSTIIDVQRLEPVREADSRRPLIVEDHIPRIHVQDLGRLDGGMVQIFSLGL